MNLFVSQFETSSSLCRHKIWNLNLLFYQAVFLHEQEKTSGEEFTDLQSEKSFKVQVKYIFHFLRNFALVNKTNFYGGWESELKDYHHKVRVVYKNQHLHYLLTYYFYKLHLNTSLRWLRYNKLIAIAMVFGSLVCLCLQTKLAVNDELHYYISLFTTVDSQ